MFTLSFRRRSFTAVSLRSLVALAVLILMAGRVIAAPGSAGNSPTTPRPAAGVVLEMHGLTPGAYVVLLDAQGHELEITQADETGARLPFAGLPAGRYTIQLATDQDTALVVEFNGRRITHTAEMPVPPVQASVAVDGPSSH